MQEKHLTIFNTHLWRRQWHPIALLLSGKSHGRRSLVGCSPWGRQESDTTERLHFHFSLSCIGEGNGNPLLCSCLENPRDGGTWWAAVSGVAQSRTRLKRLNSSSSSMTNPQLTSYSLLKNQRYPYKIRIKTWMPTIVSFIQHNIGSLGQSNQARKINKNLILEERSKTVTTCR